MNTHVSEATWGRYDRRRVATQTNGPWHLLGKRVNAVRRTLCGDALPLDSIAIVAVAKPEKLSGRVCEDCRRDAS